MRGSRAGSSARRFDRYPAGHPCASPPRCFNHATTALLVAAMVIGSGVWSLGEVALSLLGWLLLCWAWWRQSRGDQPPWGAMEWAVVGVLVALSLHLVPLPASIVDALPGRAALQAGLVVAGADASWRPLTLDPSAGFMALAALLPAAAILVSLRAARDVALLTAARWVVILACASAILGLLQVAGGADSVLRLHQFHNLAGALGFFSYRNHQAAFLMMVIPLAVALALVHRRSSGSAFRIRRLLAYSAPPLLMLGLVFTYSRAGLVLGLATVLACVLLAGSAAPEKSKKRWFLPVVGAIAGLAGLASWLAFSGLASRFRELLQDEARGELYVHVVEIARPYQPVGAGLGAFEQSFQAAPPNVGLLGAYMNHAHNEWLQIWLELGWPGVLLASVALTTLAVAGWRVWRPKAGGAVDAGGLLARAATISIALAALHACVDYSLRSGCNLAVLAMLAAMLLREGYPRKLQAARAGETGTAIRAS